MRIASWVFVVCAVLAAISVFVASAELELGGLSLGKRGSLSLYEASSNRDLVRRMLAGYHASGGKKLGGALVGALFPHARGRLHEALDDARDAMSTLDDVSDGDARTAGRILAVTVWAYLLLHVAMIVLIGGDVVAGTYRRKRIIAALVMAALVAIAAIAIHVGWRTAVWEANDELGKPAVGLAGGAYLMPIAAVGALAAAVTLLVLQVRSTRRVGRA